ncbi:MAG: phosphate regulon sensor histidine kinase PhoR [Burkholderiaceae bacterium]
MALHLPRSLVIALAVAAGGVVGATVSTSLGRPSFGAVVGAALAAAIVVAGEAWRGYRLIRWLRGAHDAPAPGGSGWWGELGHRIERELRLRDQGRLLERDRLTQFLSAIEASPNGVMLLDAGDHIEWCSNVSADHFGLDPQRDRRQRVTNLVRNPAFVQYLQEGRYAEAVQMQVPGRRGPGLLSVLIRRYGDGQKLVLSNDITERERSEAMRRDFVANVSHEIRTPLTVLAGFIETLSTLPLTADETRRVLVLMTQQAHRMQSLVNDLLILAQLEGSPRPLADRWVAVASLMAQVEADALALSAGRHKIGFAAAGVGEIAGAQGELLSALTNLVSNAVRYTPPDGRVDVAWRVLPDGSGELSVTDSGPGIAREHLPRLTERFYRVDGSRSRDTGGTGLGLSIVKHVVQRHGGELDIRSEVGRGSTFRLVFPASRVRQTALEPVVASASD